MLCLFFACENLVSTATVLLCLFFSIFIFRQKSGKGRFLFGPTPNHSFGPKASLSGIPELYDGEWRDVM